MDLGQYKCYQDQITADYRLNRPTIKLYHYDLVAAELGLFIVSTLGN